MRIAKRTRSACVVATDGLCDVLVVVVASDSASAAVSERLMRPMKRRALFAMARLPKRPVCAAESAPAARSAPDDWWSDSCASPRRECYRAGRSFDSPRCRWPLRWRPAARRPVATVPGKVFGQKVFIGECLIQKSLKYLLKCQQTEKPDRQQSQQLPKRHNIVVHHSGGAELLRCVGLIFSFWSRGLGFVVTGSCSRGGGEYCVPTIRLRGTYRSLLVEQMVEEIITTPGCDLHVSCLGC